MDDKAPLAITRREQLLAQLEREGAVRITDVADRMGVTSVTVRRDIAALAEQGVLRRVHGGAVRLDSPDQEPRAVEALRPARTGAAATIGMMVPSLDYYWPSVIRGAEEVAAEHGMRLILRGSSYRADDARSQIEHLLSAGAATGLVLTPNMEAEHTEETLEWLDRLAIPVVLTERTASAGLMHLPWESVTSDHAEGAALALRHLASLGHRRVGIVAAAASPTTPHLLRGWHAALGELGIDAAADLEVEVPDPTAEHWNSIADEVIDAARAVGATALLVHPDAAATALVQRCAHHGISVPEDLSLVAYDDEFASLFSPSLTAVRPPRQSIGRAAMGLLAARFADPARPRHRVVIAPSLRVRESTVAPRKG